MNTRTLGCFCTSRIGRADIDVASRAVDLFASMRTCACNSMNSQARQLCYPRSNFSFISSPHQGGHRGSLGPYFYSEFHLIRNSVRLTFALALYSGFLTHLSQPLGPADIKSNIVRFIQKSSIFRIFSAGCHPSQTVHLMVSLLRDKQRKF